MEAVALFQVWFYRNLFDLQCQFASIKDLLVINVEQCLDELCLGCYHGKQVRLRILNYGHAVLGNNFDSRSFGIFA